MSLPWSLANISSWQVTPVLMGHSKWAHAYVTRWQAGGVAECFRGEGEHGEVDFMCEMSTLQMKPSDTGFPRSVKREVGKVGPFSSPAAKVVQPNMAASRYWRMEGWRVPGKSSFLIGCCQTSGFAGMDLAHRNMWFVKKKVGFPQQAVLQFSVDIYNVTQFWHYSVQSP
jgi:hypothetical protein